MEEEPKLNEKVIDFLNDNISQDEPFVLTGWHLVAEYTTLSGETFLSTISGTGDPDIPCPLWKLKGFIEDCRDDLKGLSLIYQQNEHLDNDDED